MQRQLLILLAIMVYLAPVSFMFAYAEDGKQHNRHNLSVNNMATQLMTWYGRLITSELIFYKQPNHWQKQRENYPADIKQIQILKTDLVKIKEHKHYQFDVSIVVSYQQQGQWLKQYRDERFEFELADDKTTISQFSVLKASKPTTAINHSEQFDGLHFKSREFAYNWLAQLDSGNYAQSLDKVSYLITIGSQNIDQKFHKALTKRQQFLSLGGHRLRNIDINKITGQQHTYLLDITMDWQGVNNKNKTVIAKINQQIEIEVNNKGDWLIKSITEKHLLPDLSPWQDILC